MESETRDRGGQWIVNDKELADKVVALGVGNKSKTQYSDINPLWRTPSGHHLDAPEFVRDWRVVGALLKQVFDRRFSFMVMQMPDGKPMMTIQRPIGSAGEYADPSTRRGWASQVVDNDLPRAITSACVSALSTGGSGNG